MLSPESKEDRHAAGPMTPPDNSSLNRRSWRNWFLLAAVSVITTIGLATAMPPLLSERVANIWPWANTDLVLLVGLSVSMLVFVTYLTQQQRQVAGIHRQLQQLQEEASERTRRHYSRLFALFNVSRIMGAETNLQGVFDGITRTCLEGFDCDWASLMLLDERSRELVVQSASGRSSKPNIFGNRQKMGEGIAGWAAEHQEALLLQSPFDTGRYPGLKLEARSISASMVVPIILRDELVGVLNVSAQSPDVRYDEEDLRALRVFAENVGACIRHAEQADWLRQSNEKLRRELQQRGGGRARQRGTSRV